MRLLDGIGHHAVLDRLALLHTESLHEALDPVRRENAHEVVFQRQVEPGKTGVALPTRAAAQLVVDTARFVALGTEDMQPAGIQYLLVTLLPGRLEFHPPGIVDRARGCKLCLKVTAKYDVCAPAGHIGGDSDHPRPPGLGDDLRLLLVIFGVQHLVRDIGLAEALGQLFRGFHRGGTHQHRRALGHTILDVRHDGVEFLFLAQVHKVVEVFALLGHVGGNHQYLQAVNLAKFKGLGIGGAGHAGQLAVKAEIVLEGRGRQGLALALDGYPLFCLNRLVQALGQAPSRHGPPGVLVDQHHLPVLHDVLDIAVEHDVRPQAGVHVVQQVEISGRVQALALRQQFLPDHQGLDVLMPLFRQLHMALLFIDSKVTGLPLHVGLQQGDHTVDALVQLRTVLGCPGDNQRGAGLVDQDGIDLIHDREAQRSLHLVFQRKRHVIAQVIKPEFVVGAIDDIGAVGLTLFALCLAGTNHANRHPEKLVQRPHPVGIPAGEIVVDRYQVDAVAGQGIEVGGQRRHQGLAFAGAHLGYFALVQGHAADQLDIEMAHTQHPLTRLSGDRKGLGENLVQAFTVRDSLPELGCFARELLVIERRSGIDQGIDLLYHLAHAFQFPVIAGTEQFLQAVANHRNSLFDIGEIRRGGCRDAYKA